jgi:release factor glutamine methyltransferase
MNTREALAHATHQLAASPHLRPDAARDATLLLLHTLSLTRAQLLADSDRPLTPAQQSTYEALMLRRLTHEPIQYITGEQEFYGLALHVTPAVLIPRPETEHLVESVLAEFSCHPAAQRRDLLSPSSAPAQEPLRILDIGTGSGAIAIALAAHLPHARITATDISPAALTLARANAFRHNLTPRIRFLESDLLSALAPASSDSAALSPTETFEIIVSNPPYVPTSDRATLHPQVRDHEPASALFAGPDGLDLYRRLIPQARAALTPHGLLALEIGHNQRDPIAALLTDWHSVRFLNDLQQIPRVALARKP